MLLNAAPNIERTGVKGGFILSAGALLVPTISIGLLFAQGVKYQPAVAPVLPGVAANAQRWLFYNSITGFYWAASDTPATPGDAFLGWVRTDGTKVIALAHQSLLLADENGSASSTTPSNSGISTIGTASPAGAGDGVPDGGTKGQALVKQSATDYDMAWSDVLAQLEISNEVDTAVVVASHAGIDVDALSVVGGGAVTDNYGLRVKDQTAGTNNYNIWSGAPISAGVAAAGYDYVTGGTYKNVLTGSVGAEVECSIAVLSAPDAIDAMLHLTHAGTITYAFAAWYEAVNVANGDVTWLGCLNPQVGNNGAGVVANAEGIVVNSGYNNGAGSITNLYGINIDDQTVGTTANWAIKTGKGVVEFGDVLKLNGNSTSKRQLALPSMGGDPGAPVSGDVWNNSGILKFRNGAATEQIGTGAVIDCGTY